MEMNLEQFAAQVFEAARQAGVAPAELLFVSSESFAARVRDGALEDYQVSGKVSARLRGRVGERIGTASSQAMDEESIALLIQGVIDVDKAKLSGFTYSANDIAALKKAVPAVFCRTDVGAKSE